MAERATSRFKRLFEVRMLHHYWLDDGATDFDRIADQAKRDSRLLAYDMHSFLAVTPTPSAEEGLGALHCLFKPTALGFCVAVPAEVVVPLDTVFTFVVSVIDSRFFNYTALTLRPQKIYEPFDPADNSANKVTYRFKENVPVLSNLTGVARGGGANAALHLSREIPSPAASDQVEALVQSGAALVQLTSDSPGATTQQLDAQATNLPAYVNQADAPIIVPPPGVSGAPARGVMLSPDLSDDVFALLSLAAVRPDNDAYSFVDATGAAKPVSPVYQVHFKNRSTFWTYLNKQTGAVDSTETNPLPLTYFGNAGTKQKPSRGIVKAQMNRSKIIRLISEIYI